MTRGPLRIIAAAAALALVAAACGDDDDEAEAPEEAEAPAEGGEEPTGEPITIGVLTSVTEAFSPWGLQVRDGMQLAVDEINAEGGVDGRPLELEIADDQNVPEEGVSGIERLVEQEVVAIGGVISSAVGVATAPIAEEAETPLFLVKAGSEAILTQDSRFTFRTCLPAAPMVAAPIAQFAEEEGLTRVGAIIADYAWGQAFQAAAEEAFGALEGVELQVEVAPVEEQDFTTYLRNLEGVELLLATGHPPGSGPITVQSQDLGIDVDVTGAWSVLPLVVEGAGDAATGRYADFDCADFQSEEYQDLARRYLESSDNTFMDDDAVAGYGIVTMVAQAVEEVGDDPVAVAEYLHEQTFDDLPGYAFDVSWTEWGELAAAQPIFSVIGEGPAPEGVNEGGDWYPETLSQSDPLEPYEPAE
ncbi:MAG: ABC transporter substrate-binding protein [Acidimicrobiales bacterium]